MNNPDCVVYWPGVLLLFQLSLSDMGMIMLLSVQLTDMTHSRLMARVATSAAVHGQRFNNANGVKPQPLAGMHNTSMARTRSPGTSTEQRYGGSLAKGAP